MSTHLAAGREKARRLRSMVCQECGTEYKARSSRSMYCDPCRRIVHRRRVRQNYRRKNGYTGRYTGLTCTRCGEKKPHSEYDISKGGRYRRQCRACYNPERKAVATKAVPDEWIVPRPLTKREALMYRVGGPSPCFYCRYASKCRERVAALDDRPLPCFEQKDSD